jgi:putative tryptophan/tyrosine transport system substrate-binding protein
VRRREFIALVGGTAAWPILVRAQQPSMPTIGVLVLGNPDPEPFFKGLREALHRLGYVDGHNIRFELRSAQGKANVLPEAAAELVGLKVTVIVTWQTPAVFAAKQATNDIPIVMGGAIDPVEGGLVASFSRPGGNITGIAGLGPGLGGKNIEFIREVLPSARRVAVLANTTDPFTKAYLVAIELAARMVNIEIQAIMLRPGEEFDEAFADMGKKQADAVIIQPSLLRKDAVDLALKHGFPSFSHVRQLPAIGGLASYGEDFAAQQREVAAYVDRIFKGSRAADLPVAQSTKFELVINLKTAKALSLTIPASLLARADEVIE